MKDLRPVDLLNNNFATDNFYDVSRNFEITYFSEHLCCEQRLIKFFLYFYLVLELKSATVITQHIGLGITHLVRAQNFLRK